MQHGLLLGNHTFPGLAESEDTGFDGAGAIEPPFVCGDGLGGIPLENADGVEGLDDGLAVFLEGIVLIGGARWIWPVSPCL